MLLLHGWRFALIVLAFSVGRDTMKDDRDILFYRIREYFFNYFRHFIANQSFMLSFFTFFQDFRHHSDPRRMGNLQMR